MLLASASATKAFRRVLNLCRLHILWNEVSKIQRFVIYPWRRQKTVKATSPMMIPAAIANIVNPGILRLLSVMDGVPAVAVDERVEDWVLVSLW